MAWSRSCAKPNSGWNPSRSGKPTHERRSRTTSRLDNPDDDVADVRAAEARSEQRANGVERSERAVLREVVRGVAPLGEHRVPRGGVDHRARRVAVPVAAVGAG